MKIINTSRHSARRFRMGMGLTVLALFATSGLIALFCIYLQPGSFILCMKGFLRQPLLILLNWLPSFFLTTILYFAFGNVFYSGAVGTAVLGLMSYTNLLKFEGREDTLVPADIFLLREAADAVKEYHLEMHWGKVAAIAVLALGLFLLGCFLKSARPRRPVRTLGALTVLGIFALSVRFVYTDRKLFESFEVPERYNIGSVFNTLGFPYCFLYNIRLYPVDRPADYSAAEVEKWMAEPREKTGELDFQPNVIIIMCEAFSDLSAEDVFSYSEEENPLYDYYRACDSELALNGHIVVSNYGAGTANTEFDVMTGMQTNMIGDGTTSAFRVVRKKTNSLAGVLNADGYHSFFLHPGQSWFYNRNSVYAHMGITDQVFKEAFDRKDYKGVMISDAAFLEKLENVLQNRQLESDAPLFCYAVTIQNHQAYNWEKYDEPVPQAEVDVPLSDGAMEQVSVYLEGVRDSSAMLLALTEYVDSLPEPTLLVFFGDHRPNIGSSDAELGLNYGSAALPEAILDTCTVPFMIRANKAFGERADVPAAYAALRLPEDRRISDNYLGGIVLSLTGHDGENAYFDFLNDLRLELPILWPKKSVYVLADGTLTTEITPERQALVDKLAKWTYYLLRN